MSSSTNPEKSKPERERQDWGIVLIILLIGFLCVIVSAQWALRFSPSWTLDANMGSNLDLNSEFLTSKPVVFFEPIDPAILTQPGWVNGNAFLTPGASVSFVNSTPLPTSNTAVVPTTVATTPVGTTTLAVTISPTSTLIWFPLPATSTSKPNGPANTATNTSPAPIPNVNLGITQAEVPPTTTYVANSTLIYRVIVTNAGPDNVIGAIVTNMFTAQISGATWSCTAAGTVCGAGGPGNVTDVVNLPVGSSITYTINATIMAGASGDLVHTASVSVPAGYMETNAADNTSIDTNTLTAAIPSADLQITMTDSTTNYTPGAPRTYTIQVLNNGPDNITGATVTDNFLLPISGFTPGGCAVTGGATCGWSGSGNINDTVNLPAGSTITYTVNVTTDSWYLVNLVNTASVSAVGYTEAAPGNESVTDTDTLVINPPGAIGSSSDCDTNPFSCTTELSAGSTLILSTNIVVPPGGHPGWDLIYYERPNGGNIRMDWVILQISDGSNSYTILDWGNQGGGGADTNTNINVNVIGGSETDDRVISQNNLYPYPGTGVAIELDGFVPPGTYTYIRIIVPSTDPTGNGCGIDAIEILP